MLARWKKSLNGRRVKVTLPSDVDALTDGGPTASVDGSQTMFCKLCLSDCRNEQMYALEKCHCAFCLECVKQYVEVQINNSNAASITCPDTDCRRHGVMDAAEIKKLVTAELFSKYSRLHVEREVHLDPTRTFCPRPNCDNICQITSGVKHGRLTAAAAARPVICSSCGLRFCSQCLADWHDCTTCDDNMMAVHGQIDGIPFTSAEDSLIKRCPVCRVPIERDSGCAQMMCKRCKHVFCWYCLASLDDDILLRHYDKGSCKNKLGHSRASVIWHRTQVIGIFAGFGLLLLIASPFLLLVAPCILCCKCRRCRCSADDNAAASSTG